MIKQCKGNSFWFVCGAKVYTRLAGDKLQFQSYVWNQKGHNFSQEANSRNMIQQLCCCHCDAKIDTFEWHKIYIVQLDVCGLVSWYVIGWSVSLKVIVKNMYQSFVVIAFVFLICIEKEKLFTIKN